MSIYAIYLPAGKKAKSRARTPSMPSALWVGKAYLQQTPLLDTNL